MTMEERAQKVANQIAFGEGGTTVLILAALRAQREEALEEAAKECESQLAPFAVELAEYSKRRFCYSGDCKDADLRARCDVLVDSIDNIRALKTQTGSGVKP